ncbi:MAG: hypothetical protein ABIF89_01730 [bacterium]
MAEDPVKTTEKKAPAEEAELVASQDETSETDSNPETEETSSSATSSGFSVGPEIIILFLAIFLDIVNLILICVALDDFFICDIVGLIFIGGWIFVKHRELKTTSKTSQKITAQFTKWTKRMKWLRPMSFLLELIPYVGVLPCWTILTLSEFKQPIS